MTKCKCPHCGNANRELMEDNGIPSREIDFTLLCVARVKPGEDSFDGEANPPLEVGADGLVTCGMQWTPND